MHRRAYTIAVEYEWHPKKASGNLRKHAIDFADAVIVLEDESALTIDDSDSDERRYLTIGLDAIARILVVVHSWRGENIRIISARKATPAERRQYEERL